MESKNSRSNSDVRRRRLLLRLAMLWLLAPGRPAVSGPASAAGFADPAARRMAQAVEAGDVDAAPAAARTVPGGVNAHGTDGETALLLAVNRLDRPMIAALLKAGADPNGAPDRAPIHEAVKAHDQSVTKMLLKAGASPDGSMGGEPALFEAALLGATDPADLLLSAGARVDRHDKIGNSAALVAASADHWTMVGFLLGRGASIWAVDAAGVTIGGLAVRSRLLPDSPKGIALADVVARLKAGGFPMPPPTAREIKTLVALKNWPPTGK